MLKDNPELYQLYKDLVVSGVITAEEFWANRGKVFTIMSTFVQVESVSFFFLGPGADNYAFQVFEISQTV